ncbi:hypothetical protein [Streptomyces canus]|uniref:hypothetical protein n=1 Tax=Streptomyces canus TaxID=58343 RepID=UPI0030E32FA7
MVGSWAATSPANGVERLGQDAGLPAARRLLSRVTDPARHRKVQIRRRADTSHDVRDRVHGGRPARTGSAGPDARPGR